MTGETPGIYRFFLKNKLDPTRIIPFLFGQNITLIQLAIILVWVHLYQEIIFTFPLCKSYYTNEYFIDRTSNYSDEPDTDDLSSLLTGWEDAPSDPSLKTPGQPDSQEELNSDADAAVGMSTERQSESPPPETPSAPPSLDIEADITFGEQISGQSFLPTYETNKQFSAPVNILYSWLDVYSFKMMLTVHERLSLAETLERMSQHKGLSQESPSSPSSALRRQQTSRKAREAKVTVAGLKKKNKPKTLMKGEE